MRARANSKIHNAVSVKGFYRLQIVEERDKRGRKLRTPRVVGDTGWRENTVVNDGFDQYICRSIAGMSGSKSVSHAALGTGTAPGATDTTLNGELTDASNCRCAVTPTTIASKTIQFAFTLSSNIITANRTIQNVGLFQQSNTNTATILAGQTYSTSQLQTNQAVNGSYQLRFS